MRKYFILFTCLVSVAAAQEPAIEWQHLYGGLNGVEDAKKVIQTSDGGYLIVGNTNSNDGDVSGNNGSIDAWVIKIDDAGNLVWQKCIGGNSGDYATSVKETSDGGYIVGGYTFSQMGVFAGNHGASDVMLVKLSVDGEIEWIELLGGSLTDRCRDLELTDDGGYILVANTVSTDGDITINQGQNDVWVIKVSPVGDMQWQRTYGGTGHDIPYGIDPTKNGGWIIAGFTDSNDGDVSGNHGGEDMWLLEIDEAGNLLWQKCFGGSLDDQANDVYAASDGGYLVAGYSSSADGDLSVNQGNEDLTVLKVSSNSDLEWVRSVGGTGIDIATAVGETPYGQFVITGYTSSSDGDLTGIPANSGSMDFLVLELDEAGNVNWSKCFGGPTNEWSLGGGVITSDKGIIMAGYVHTPPTGQKIWVIKLTRSYNTITGKVFADLNLDQIQNGDEPSIMMHTLSESTSDRLALTSGAGIYLLPVLAAGSYEVTPAHIQHYSHVPTATTVEFTDILETSSGIDFAFQPIGVINDLLVEISPLSFFRPGFAAYYQIKCRNVGTTTINSSVSFYPNDLLMYVDASIQPDETTDSITWVLPELVPFQYIEMTVEVMVLTNAPLGEMVTSSARVFTLVEDVVPANDQASWPVIVTGSYDPNDILVDRSSIHLSDLPTTGPLDYIIRFQNTGTDTAFTVVIKNPLPANVDRTSFSFIDSSHEVELDYSNETNTMWFRFNNIVLPDSNTNEALSHGFVRYRIQPVMEVALGDSILNQASIFFDFNAPVITNTAYTVIENSTGISERSGIGFQMFPNPTSGILQIRMNSISDQGTLLLHDPLGREVLRDQVKGTRHQLDLSDQAKGIYLITLQTDQGISTQRLVLE